MRRTHALGAAAVVAALAAVAGCSTGGGGSNATGGASGGAEAKSLTIWEITLQDSQTKALNTWVSDFEAANPGVKVNVEYRSTDAHKEAMRQVAGTGAGPDIYFYWEGPGLGGELVKQGVSLDLTKYYEQYGWKDRFSAAALTGVSQYGGYNGVPWTQQGEAIYYNKALFKKAGITSTPTTYDELVADADKLVAAGVTPIEFGGTVNWHVMRLLDSIIETKCGSTTADQLNTKQKGWDTEPCVKDSFTELKKWGDKYINKGFMGISNDDSSQLFYTGQAAMALEGTWFDAQATDNGMKAEDVGIFPFPTGTGRLYGFGEALYVSKQSKAPDLAAKFLDFTMSTDEQNKSGGAFAAINVNKDVKPSTDNALHALWPPIFAAAKGMYINNDQNLSLDQTTEYWRIQNSVLTGSIAPADAGAQFQKFIGSK